MKPCHYLLLLLATASANKLRTRAKQFQKWRDARFGCGRQWHYWRCSGQLTDPATGVVIARLEGVEATRALRGDARRGDSEDDVNDDDFFGGAAGVRGAKEVRVRRRK